MSRPGIEPRPPLPNRYRDSLHILISHSLNFCVKVAKLFTKHLIFGPVLLIRIRIGFNADLDLDTSSYLNADPDSGSQTIHAKPCGSGSATLIDGC
jgi:hypothetical protein